MRHSLIITLLIAAFGLTACSQQQENLPVSASAASETSAAVEQIANAASDAANDKSDESEIALYYQQPDPELKRARSVLHRFFNSPYAQKESALFNLSRLGRTDFGTASRANHGLVSGTAHPSSQQAACTAV